MNNEGTAFALPDDVANQPSPVIPQNVRQSERPVQDEWGIFDPQQAGLEALLRRLKSPADNDRAPEPPAPAKK
jgi:hypothetical protein